jgi:predicted lipoprotein
MDRAHRSLLAVSATALIVLLACNDSQLNEPLADKGKGTKNSGATGAGRGGSRDGGTTSGGSGSTRDGGPASGGNSGTGGDDDPNGSAASGSSGTTGGNSGAGGDEPFVVPPFSKSNLLESIGGCALASYRDFVAKAVTLEESTRKLADAPDAAALAAAQDAWRTAMASWQRAEPFRFGPAARTPALGALDLRDEIYAFPHGDPCKVDQTLVDQSYASAEFASSLISGRGLGALEYLLFYDGGENACVASSAINGDGSWAALSADDLAQRRADYAAAAAREVRAKADALVHAWDPAGDDFLAHVSRPGRGGSVYANAQEAFNAISDGLFMLDKEVKDWKLGWPLGLVTDCVNAPNTCPNAVESRHARVSTQNLQQNLHGFRDAFEGCGPDHAGLGFDDWLREMGAGDLADRLVEALVGTEHALSELEPRLEDAIASDPPRVLVVHAAAKRATDLLKTELVTVLDLELPLAVEGDND